MSGELPATLSGDAPSPDAAPAPTAPAERRFSGIAVSPGIAIGQVFKAAEEPAAAARRSIAAADVRAETDRLDAAIEQSRRQLTKLRGKLAVLPENAQAEIGPLLDAYLQMIGPSRLVRGARARIAAGLVAAETAVADESAAIAAAVLATPNPDDQATQARQADEVREIGRRLVRNLTHAPFRSFALMPGGAVLVAEVLRPADAALLDPSRLAGVATEEGGADGHTAIMLRALGVPAVLGAARLMQAAQPGDLVVVDGGNGMVAVHPTEPTLAEARRQVAVFARGRQRLARLRRLPAVTLDGVAVELQANMEIPAELPLISQAGAAGIGLLRSEFLFMNRETLPDEAAQYETYRGVVEAMDGDGVTIRVLDWGGEKEIEALSSGGAMPGPGVANPALGVRGIRLLLRRPDLFETQLAAILRAAANTTATGGRVRVLLPMVTNVAELLAARETYRRVADALRRRGERLADTLPPLGVMIETPGAALSADALAQEADFFAIGTNDLTMYTLAVDRGDSEVAGLYDPLHPAVLRLVRFATEAAARRHLPVSLCGEMAGNPRLAPLLLGLGLRSFSMNASAIPHVKRAIRALRITDCDRLAAEVMRRADPARIENL